ncbi:helix-turn-helix domain-containing protein [Kineococcus terrestris]|uniref:helix-turn-helix domain-containing protein n=1 Tax=Kineococcus terrestris TaxID=2044856 RepID=UPI0034DAEFE9
MTETLTADDVAAQLRVPRSWVDKAARRGEIGSRKIGRYRRFLQSDVDDFLAVCHRAASDPLLMTARSYAAHSRPRKRRTAR